jgi:glutaminyl-peptide cyclotransferase
MQARDDQVSIEHRAPTKPSALNSVSRPARGVRALRPVATLALCLALGASCNHDAGPQEPPAPPQERPAFDRDRAFADLVAQCDFGPRVPGSEAHQQCKQFLLERLEAAAERTVVHEFSAATALGGPYEFSNLIGVFSEDAEGAVLLLAAHWDSRARADRDPDPALRDQPVPGANDGASGVAVLLEMMRAFAQAPPPRPVLVAFFDAEDQGQQGYEAPQSGWAIGSRRLADEWPEGLPWPEEMVLLDLVGGDNKHNERVGVPALANDRFDLPMEAYSLDHAPTLVDRVWSVAERLGHEAFERRRGTAVMDDHIPFQEAGVAAIDIIDFVPPEWDTTDDTPEHCSPDSLWQVGDTLLAFIYEE